MILKAYRNELIVLLSALLFLSAFFYAQHRKKAVIEGATQAALEATQIKEAAALRRLWHPKRLKSRVEKLKALVPASKTTWHLKGTKLEARFEGIDGSALNRLVGKLLSLPVRITRLQVTKTGASYRLECACKW